ncbi:hypothetical protein GCM10025772_24130 [Ferrimonas gelatinilytica]|uniref:Uncharacterized protein n=2 Tax=Ferrimonas gelatinilytica TaxID=1255257 RepID=A0ABP9SCH2_9GAMM
MFRLSKKCGLAAFIVVLGLSSMSWHQAQCDAKEVCLADDINVNWRHWILGSDNSQFHFVDLLELLYRPSRDSWSE